MDIILWIVWFGTYLFGAVRFELYIVHMFQQNSYKPTEYREWLQGKREYRQTIGKESLCIDFSAASVYWRKGMPDHSVSDESYEHSGK